MSDDLKKKKKKKKSSEENTSKKLVKSSGLDTKMKKKKKKSSEESGDTIVKVSGGKKLAKKEEAPEKAMLPVEKDDFIIVRIGKKNKLCFAHSPKRNTAYIEDTMANDEPQTVEYTAETLVANLGSDPAPGKAYGVDIQPHYGEVATPIGPMHIYRKLEDEEKEAITIAIKRIKKKVEEQGLGKVFPFTRLEVLNAKGKWAGTYSVSFKSGTPEDMVKLHPKIISDQIYNQYIFAHEIGHGIWFKFVSEKVRAEWLEIYNSLTKVSKAKKQEMEDLCTSLVASQQSVREFQRDIEEDELALFKEALGYLKKHHKMSPEDVNTLLNQNSKALAAIWPTSASYSNSESLISEYAKVSVQEMFAEAYAYHTTGKEIPKSVKKLLEKTLKNAQASD
jgi:hypothetical protein